MIHSTLRVGDVYTRYFSSQYLVLVIDTTEGQGYMIGDRIKEKFPADSLENDILIHQCYELQPEGLFAMARYLAAGFPVIVPSVSFRLLNIKPS